jgi:hypothetical protein
MCLHAKGIVSRLWKRRHSQSLLSIENQKGLQCFGENQGLV